MRTIIIHVHMYIDQQKCGEDATGDPFVWTISLGVGEIFC